MCLFEIFQFVCGLFTGNGFAIIRAHFLHDSNRITVITLQLRLHWTSDYLNRRRKETPNQSDSIISISAAALPVVLYVGNNDVQCRQDVQKQEFWFENQINLQTGFHIGEWKGDTYLTSEYWWRWWHFCRSSSRDTPTSSNPNPNADWKRRNPLLGRKKCQGLRSAWSPLVCWSTTGR